jgi:hypothetical protein
MDLEGLSPATLDRLERIKKLKNCDTINAVQYSITLGWLASERAEQKKTMNLPANVIPLESSSVTKERIARGGYNPAVEGPESRV